MQKQIGVGLAANTLSTVPAKADEARAAISSVRRSTTSTGHLLPRSEGNFSAGQFSIVQ